MLPQPPPALPELRQDLRLEPGASDVSGVPTWLIVDGAQHRYVQIDETSYQILSQWQGGISYDELAQRVDRAFDHAVTAPEIDAFVRFLADNSLTLEPVAGGWRHYREAAERRKHGWLMWLVHNYLFIRIPLVRPEPYLKRLSPLVAPLYSRGFFIVVAMAGCAGLYLVSRQWDEFIRTFQHVFSWQGALTSAVAIALIKSAHELGHALTAVRFGCRVPSMGVCFMVMVPMLYTDVTDAWRLQNRRERLYIGSAGVIVELILAAVATLLWPFLPEGIWKSLAFSIATVGWILSLAINLNPLMRFDGYYIFADAIGIDNLQQRSFAFGQWRLREILFDLKAPPPERLTPQMSRTLTLFAWSVWIYRLVLFTGIALLVYHMAFKVLGIILFLIEIVYFILRPIWAELLRWSKERGTIVRSRRAQVTGLSLLALIVAAVIPWSSRVTIPAVLEAAELARVYPQRSGIVKKVHVSAGDRVEAGDALVELESAELQYQIQIASRKLALIKMQLSRRSADEQDRAKSIVMEQELAALSSQIAGLKREGRDLIIRAPQGGVVSELNSAVHPGRPISRTEFVALVRGSETLVARGYVSEADVGRVGPAARGSFVAEEPGYPRIPVSLGDIARAASSNIDILELASIHGGAVAVRQQNADRDHTRLSPVAAAYLVTLAAEPQVAAPPFAIRGTVQLAGERQSLAARAWRQVASVLVRESGF